MSETVKPTIAALRAWLKTCPLIADEQEATGCGIPHCRAGRRIHSIFHRGQSR